MANSRDFEFFLKDINPSKTTICEASRLHRTLRSYLKSSESYEKVYLDSYLSGSYAKHTFIRPEKDTDGCDVDVVVETTHDTSEAPYSVLSELRDALLERRCYKDVRIQSHSVGVELSGFHIDVVPLVKDEQRSLYIGSSNEGTWSKTNPRGHISWSAKVNRDFEENYKSLVKVIKWWRRENCPEGVKFPKGITLEKMIADNLPERGLLIEEIIVQTMANLSTAYDAELGSDEAPFIEDPVLAGNNLAASYSLADFRQFVDRLKEHLDLLTEEGDGNSTWKKILGSNFPSGNRSGGSTCLSHMTAGQEAALSVPHRLQFGYKKQSPNPNALITAELTLPYGKTGKIESDGESIPKGSSVLYRLVCAPISGAKVKWQVTNTGTEAMNRNDLRGDFVTPNYGATSRREGIAYTGKHYVQCFVIKNGICVRWTKPFFINVE